MTEIGNEHLQGANQRLVNTLMFGMGEGEERCPGTRQEA